VRATGSGMGCPDWPKCFGLWIPPTQLNELPTNYARIYGEKLKGEVVFNPYKTWIEYLNRLAGVLVGLFSFICTLLAFRFYFRSHRPIFYACFAALILIILEGWLGSKVVSSELNPYLITLHMLLAVVIMGLLLFAVLETFKMEGRLDFMVFSRENSFLVLIIILMCLAQVVFGTQIREGIDLAEQTMVSKLRLDWVNSQRGKVWFHGGFSFIIFISMVFLSIKSKSYASLVKKSANFTLLLTGISIVSGAILGFMGLPAVLQPVHLVLSVCILSGLFVLYYFYLDHK
jgi:cytochrome c oxidase assembly protein subunit 15